MSTYVPGFKSFFSFFASFRIGQINLATSSIRVNLYTVGARGADSKPFINDKLLSKPSLAPFIIQDSNIFEAFAQYIYSECQPSLAPFKFIKQDLRSFKHVKSFGSFKSLTCMFLPSLAPSIKQDSKRSYSFTQ